MKRKIILILVMAAVFAGNVFLAKAESCHQEPTAAPAKPVVKPAAPTVKPVAKKLSDNTLVRGADKKIYVLKGGKRVRVATLAELKKFVGKKIIDLKQSEIDIYPLAETAIVKTEIAKPKYSAEQIVPLAEKFIRENLLSDQYQFTVKVKNHQAGLYLLDITIGSDAPASSAISDDGIYFFPTALKISEVEAIKAKEAPKPQVLSGAVKTARPTVELFVMSHCPYGTQMEKGIIPVLDKLGATVDFKLKFVDYAMHGDKELNEQLNQYCLGEQQPDKLIPYLKCFLEAGDGQGCLTKTGVDQTKLSACVKETDAKYQITAGAAVAENYPAFNIYKADNDKYGVQGSPTLVINGAAVETTRSSQGLLETICAYFTDKPAACSASLSAEAPSPGFGYAASPSSGNASCGE